MLREVYRGGLGARLRDVAGAPEVSRRLAACTASPQPPALGYCDSLIIEHPMEHTRSLHQRRIDLFVCRHSIQRNDAIHTSMPAVDLGKTRRCRAARNSINFCQQPYANTYQWPPLVEGLYSSRILGDTQLL